MGREDTQKSLQYPAESKANKADHLLDCFIKQIKQFGVSTVAKTLLLIPRLLKFSEHFVHSEIRYCIFVEYRMKVNK